MLERLTCLQGHAWDAPPGESARCPECGLPPDPGLFADPEDAPAPAPPPISDDAGRPVVVGYEILADRGRSPAGVRLYQAKQLVAGREVLLEVVLAREDIGQRAWNSLRGEASGHGRLSHPHIVQLYETGERDRQLFYNAMECVDGPTLADAVGDEPVPVAQAVALVELLARAVAYAHAQRQFHRHLEPSAVLLQRVPAPEAGPAKDHPGGGVCRIGEGFYVPRLRGFGLARRPVEGDILDVDLYADAGYLSPEQSWGKGQELGPHTDVYGLGGILYFLLTGRPPFRGPTQEDVIDAIQTAPLVKPSDIRRTPATLDYVCRAALARRVSRRYADATEMADDLRRVMEDRSPALFRPTFRQRVNLWRKRRPGWAALLFMGVVCVASTLIAYGVGGSGGSPPPRKGTFSNDGELHAENHRLRERLRDVKQWQRSQDYRQQIVQARLVAGTDKRTARSALDECEETERGFEWHYLDGLVVGKGKTLLPDTEDVTAIAFLPTVGEAMARLLGKPWHQTIAVARTNPGEQKSTIQVLEIATFAEQFSITVTAFPVRRIKPMLQDEFVVLAGTKPGRVYAFRKGGMLGQEDTVDSPSLIGTGVGPDQILVLNGLGDIRQHDASNASPVGPVRSTRPAGIPRTERIRVAVLPRGMGVVVSDPNKEGVHLWSDGPSGVRFEELEEPVECMASNPEGTLAVATEKKRIYFANIAAGVPSATPYQGERNDVRQMAFSPDGKRLAVAYPDGTITVLGFAAPRPEDLRFDGKGVLGWWAELLTIPVSGVRGLEFGPDGKTLAASGPKGVVVLGAWK